MNVVEATIEVLLRDNPNMTRAEAARLAQEQHAPESRTDGAPSAPLTPDVQLDYPDQQYRYNPASRTWDDVYEEAASRSAEQDRQAQAGAHGYRWGGQVPHASDEAAADYSTRPANGPSQQDLDMLQTGEYNRSGTGWVEYYDPKTGVTVTGRRAPVPDRYTPGNPGYQTASEMRASNDPAYVPAEDSPGANLAAKYAAATGFRDWTVDGGIPEYAQGYDWGGVEQGWANEATGGGRIGRGVSNRDVQREMPQVLESPSGRSEYTRKPQLMNGPNGPVWVYMYDEESQSTRDENARAQKDELQLRRMAEKAGISMSEARALKESGGVPGDEMRGIRDRVLDRRREDKEARRKAYTDRNMLAGNDPRQNLVNAYNTLPPEMQQQAIAANLTRRQQDSDGDASKIDAIRLQLESQALQAAEDRQLQRDLDETRRQEAEAGRVQTAEEARRRFELQMAEIKNASMATQSQLVNMQEQAQLARDELAQRRIEAENANPAALATAQFERGQQAAEESRQAAARAQQIASAESAYGPGVRDMLDEENPSYNTPAAIRSLDKIARAADQSWTGFYPSDAERMDAILQRLGIADAAARRELVQKHGMATSQAAGPGRSGVISGIYNYFNWY